MIKIPDVWMKWIKRIFLVMGIGLIAVGLILSLVFNVILAPCTIRQFSIKTDANLSVFGEQLDIDCMLFEPLPEHDIYGNQRPALVLVHGFLSSKVYFRGLAYELTKRGFVCLSITGNGHGASGGGMTPTWENVTLSAVKYLRDSSSVLKIDTNRIGLVGHSMGSFSATVASILDQELGYNWLNATVGIGGPFLNISEGFGEGLAFFLSIPVVYPNIWYNPQDAVQNAVIEGRTNYTRPNNYMNIIGAQDEAFSVDSAYELMYGMSNSNFWATNGVIDQTDINSSQTYGAFNGTARRLVVIPDLGHALEGQDETTVIEVIDWFEESMKLKAETNYPGALDVDSITVVGTSFSAMLVGLGGFIIILPLMDYLGNWLKPKMDLPKKAMKMKKKEKWKMFLIYGIIFVGISFLVAPIVTGLDLLSFMPTDFLASNLIAFPILILGLLMIPVVIVLMWYEKRKYNLELRDFGLTKEPKSYLRGAFYGFLLFLVLYVTLNLASSATLHNLFIWRFAGFLELFLYLFVGLLVFELFFRGLIQNKLYQFQDTSGLLPTRVKEIVKASIITGIIQGLAMGIMTTMLLAAGGFDVFSTGMGGMIPANMGVSLDWLPPMFVILPFVFVMIEVMVGVLKAGLFRKSNRNIMTSSIFVALLLAWLLSVLMPALDLVAPRFLFMM